MKGPYNTAIFTDAASLVAKVLILAGVLGMAACSGEGDGGSASDSGKDHFLKEKTEAIDKAREVEQLIRDAAEEQRKAIQRQ